MAPPLWKTGKGGSSAVFFCARNRLRSAVSHQFRHGPPLPGGLALELGHDGVVNIEGGLHMGNHITDMDRWSA